VGKPEVTNFGATLLGVSDEMGKILGGGVATDSSRPEARHILDKAFSQAQGQGAINSIRGALANRQNSLTAGNRYLMKQYGQMTVPPVGQSRHTSFQQVLFLDVTRTETSLATRLPIERS
jgi:hypothetical protein